MSTTILQRLFCAAKPSRTCEAASFLRTCRTRTAQTPTRPIRSTPHHSQLFSTTKPVSATVVTQNPRQDEEGQDMLITISDRAAKRLRQITSTRAKRNTLSSSPSTTTSPDSHLRVTVTSGGCHGFQYLMSLEPSEKIDPEEDTVFAVEDDTGNGNGNAKVVLDESSLELLKGSTVDFTTELIGSQFKIVGNPRATSSCGCGTSFDIE